MKGIEEFLRIGEERDADTDSLEDPAIVVSIPKLAARYIVTMRSELKVMRTALRVWLKNPHCEGPTRCGTCDVLSIAMLLALKGETDPTRAIGDAVWEKRHAGGTPCPSEWCRCKD